MLYLIGSTDAWISGLGSALGALLAGIISSGVAIWIMHRQIKLQEEIKKQLELKESINNYKLIISNISLLLDFLDTVKGSVNFLERAIHETYTNTLKDIKDRGEEIKIIIQDFDRINESLIDEDVVDQYLEFRKTNVYLINLFNITNGYNNDTIKKRLSNYIESYNKTNDLFTEKVKNLNE